MRLICYPTGRLLPSIRPAPAARDWMDATPGSYANRCLPLLIANAHGWEVLSPCAFTATWSGGDATASIRIEGEGPEDQKPVSHFGSGILTFHLHALFRTDEGNDLFITGPVNRPKDGIAPLSGIVEADWMPFTFTMNWRFTRAGATVRFEREEPFCFFFPVSRGALGGVEPEIRALSSDPEAAAAHAAWTQGRDRFLRDLPVPGSPASRRGWEKTYYQGKMPDGSPGTDSHVTRVSLKPFADRRGAGSGG